jgi:hypothetical protein
MQSGSGQSGWWLISIPPHHASIVQRTGQEIPNLQTEVRVLLDAPTWLVGRICRPEVANLGEQVQLLYESPCVRRSAARSPP